MEALKNFINLFFNSIWQHGDSFGDWALDWARCWLPKAREFLQRLIENDHIEKIWEWDINDYIRYIATTEDPIQTLIDLLK